MKRALILVNAYSKLKNSLNQSARLREELALLGVRADVRLNDGTVCGCGEGGTLENHVADYDFCVYLDKDKYAARMLEKCGMRLFNGAAAIETCDDKMLTCIALAGNGVPMPDTIPAPLCYDPAEPVSERLLDGVVGRLGLPVVVKASYGSLGAGVYRADDRSALRAVAERLKCSPHLFQRYVAESAGRDARVIVIGGEVAAAMERRSRGDFRSNLELGGSGSPLSPDGELSALCRKVARLICPDYCGIDVLFGREGYMICEVNSNAFFGGMERVTGINVAAAYARYICGVMYAK